MWHNEEGCSSASQNLIRESHHGKLRETEASKQYQGIKLVLVTTNFLDNSAQQSCLHKAILIHTQMSLNMCTWQRLTKVFEKKKIYIFYISKHLTFIFI